MPYTLPPLPYPNNALEPHIDAMTMEIHHDKHHAAYVTNLNKALEGSGVAEQSIEDLCRNIETVPANIRQAVRNNGGGHANHSLFWTIMSPKGGGAPTGELAKAIDAELGGFDKAKDDLIQGRRHPLRQRLVLAQRRQGRQARRSRARRTRTTPGWKARRRSSASTSGSTPTI